MSAHTSPKRGLIHDGRALARDHGGARWRGRGQRRARWACTGHPGCSASDASSSGCEQGKAGIWVSCWVSFKANLILYIKVAFLLKNAKNGPGRSGRLAPGGDGGDESLLQKAVSTPAPATATRKLKNKSITRVNELKMSVFKMRQEKNRSLVVAGLITVRKGGELSFQRNTSFFFFFWRNSG